jgi:hypothetical protein
MMSTYMPALIWVMSGLLCLAIAKHRHVKQTTLRAMLVAIVGPLAIPLVLFAKPEQVSPS